MSFDFNRAIGVKYGMLTVISIKGMKNCRRIVEAKCDCGGIKVADFANIKSGHTRSCGCLKKKIGKASSTHGLSKHHLYRIWCKMKERCYATNNKSYKDYGGRGIIIDPEWQSFLPFYKWSIENGWQKGLEIDRINNDGNYGVNNCRYVTSKENSRNTRRNRMLTYDGVTKHFTDWIEITGIPRSTLFNRLKTKTLEEAIHMGTDKKVFIKI